MTSNNGITVGASVRVGVVSVGSAVALGNPITVGQSTPATYGGASSLSLNDLFDVNTTGEQPGDVLTFVGGDDLWESRPLPIPPVPPTTHVIVDQMSPSSTWTIVHSLGYSPNITCFDSAGNPISGVRDWPDPDSNTSIIRFYTSGIPTATSGQAICS